MTEPAALISIVIPVFNGANYLGDAIASALAQTWPNVEVIVVDDGSNDGGKTRSVIESFGDRIRAFHQPNGGVAAALNRGIAESAGAYISWLSHDDLYDPRKLELQMQLMSRSTGPCIVFGDFDLVDRDGRFIRRYERGIGYDEASPLWAVLESRINGCTLLLPRECFAAGSLFDPALPPTQDYDLWFRLARRYRFVHQPGALVRQRSHAEQGSRSQRHAEEASLLWGFMLDRLDRDDMTALGGTPIGFLLRLRRFIRTTGYAGAKARIDAMIDAEIARIPVTLALGVTLEVDVRSMIAQAQQAGFQSLSVVLFDRAEAARDSLLLRDPRAASAGRIYRLPLQVTPARILSLATALGDGRYLLSIGGATNPRFDAMRAAIEAMEVDAGLGGVLDPSGPVGNQPGDPYDGAALRSSAIIDALSRSDGHEERFGQTLALSVRLDSMPRKTPNPQPQGSSSAGIGRGPGHAEFRLPFGTGLGRSLPARAVRWLAIQPGIGSGILRVAGFASRHLRSESARLRLRRAIEILFRVGGLVDAGWYRRRYGDVAAARLDPVIHYLATGWRENRDPSADFSTRAYLEAHPALAGGPVNPLTHMTVIAKEAPAYVLPQPARESLLLKLRSGPNSQRDLERAVGILAQEHDAARPGLLLVLHTRRGGTARYSATLGNVVARSVNVAYAWGIDDRELVLSRSADGDGDVKIDLSTDSVLAEQILRRLRIGRADLLHTIGIEGRIGPLLQTLAIPFDVTFLDYHLLATQPHLCGPDGRFVGDEALVPGPGSLLRPEPSPLLRQAARILTCSRDVAARVRRLAPALHPIAIKLPEPHAPAQFRVAPRGPSPDGSFHVLLIGVVSPHKGLDFLGDVIREIKQRDLPIVLHLLGRVPPRWPAASDVDSRLQLHGPYQDSELTTLICLIRPHLAWFPFQAPETHSFALTDAMLNGLPILAGDIGAAAERLEGRTYSWLLPWNAPAAEWVSFLDRLRRENLATPANGRRTDGLPPAAPQFYETEYLRPLLGEWTHPG